MNLYEILGLDIDATVDEIKKQHRRLAKHFHPDGSYPNRDEFEMVQKAYSIISDSKKRAEYDKSGEYEDNFTSVYDEIEGDAVKHIMSQIDSYISNTAILLDTSFDIVSDMNKNFDEAKVIYHGQINKLKTDITMLWNFRKRFEDSSRFHDEIVSKIKAQTKNKSSQIAAKRHMIKVMTRAAEISADIIYNFNESYDLKTLISKVLGENQEERKICEK